MDPRFDDLAGKFKEDTFKKRYSFLFDEQLPQEKLQLKKKLKVSSSEIYHYFVNLFTSLT